MSSPTLPASSVKPPYVRLSVFYFTYFAALGIFVPYWTVYLKNVAGFSAAQIGELMAVFMASKVIAPFIWGWLADHSGQRLRIIRLASLLAMVCFAGVYWQHSYGWMLLVMAGFGFFWNASLPQFEALTLNHLGEYIGRYSWIRLWGSIGFIVMVVSLPPLLDSWGIERAVDAMLLLFITIWLTTWLVRDKPHHAHAENTSRLREVIRQPAVWMLLLACALQQASHGVYYTFFSLYLEDHGYSRNFTGWMWALGVAAEVVLFVFMHRLIQRFGAERLFVLAMLLTGIRWILLGAWVDNLPVLLLAQVLHAATYGLFHASAIHVVHHVFPGKLQGRGQALYSGVSYGLGGALGSLLSGYGWETLGSAQTFYIATVVVNVGLFLSLYAIRDLGKHYAQQVG
ncbi:MAG: MFS transporter [Candidatus Thiothrix moscowensis]|nr:MFS transporter [Candidatus Thiothrix moscowensis]